MQALAGVNDLRRLRGGLFLYKGSPFLLDDDYNTRPNAGCDLVLVRGHHLCDLTKKQWVNYTDPSFVEHTFKTGFCQVDRRSISFIREELIQTYRLGLRKEILRNLLADGYTTPVDTLLMDTEGFVNMLSGTYPSVQESLRIAVDECYPGSSVYRALSAEFFLVSSWEHGQPSRPTQALLYYKNIFVGTITDENGTVEWNTDEPAVAIYKRLYNFLLKKGS